MLLTYLVQNLFTVDNKHEPSLQWSRSKNPANKLYADAAAQGINA